MLTNSILANDFTTYFFDLVTLYLYTKQRWSLFFISVIGHKKRKSETSLEPFTSSLKKKKVKLLVFQLCLTLCNPWTVAHQAPLSMEFSRQEYWSGLPSPPLNSGCPFKSFKEHLKMTEACALWQTHWPRRGGYRRAGGEFLRLRSALSTFSPVYESAGMCRFRMRIPFE